MSCSLLPGCAPPGSPVRDLDRVEDLAAALAAGELAGAPAILAAATELLAARGVVTA
jgi:hypothetical protein